MNDCHVEEILSRSNVGQLNIVSEKDISHDEEINVRPVCWDDDQWSKLLFVVVSQFLEGLSINDDFFINGLENLV